MTAQDPLGNRCDMKVRIHLRSLGAPRVPEFTALRNAHAAFGQYGIFIEYRSGQSLPDAVETGNQCLSLQNVNVGTCTMNQSMTGEQDALFNYGSRQGVGQNDIVCYWVEQVESGGSRLAGCASHPNSQPACVVSALGSRWTLAHEIGHVLGLRHTAGTTMLMSTPTASISVNPPRLSAADVATIKTSRCCTRC